MTGEDMTVFSVQNYRQPNKPYILLFLPKFSDW